MLQKSHSNEMYELAESYKLDYDKIVSIQLDKRLGNTHFNVPGPDGDLGFGAIVFQRI